MPWTIAVNETKMPFFSAQDTGQGLTFFIYFLDHHDASFEAMSREFNFKDFSTSILITLAVFLLNSW